MSPSASEPNAELTCQVVIGLLVPRPCGEKARGACTKCQRAFCGDHAGQGGLCKHCAAGETPPAPVMAVPYDLAFDPQDLESFAVEQPNDPSNAWSDLT